MNDSPPLGSVGALLAKLRYTYVGMRGALSNSGWLLADRLARILVGAILGVFIARHLGPESYGLLSYAYALTLMLGSLAAFGTDGILLRELSVGKASQRTLLGSTIGLRLLLGLAAYLLALTYTQKTSGDSPLAMALVTILSAGVLLQSIDALDCWFQSRLQSKFTVLARFGAFFVVAIVKIWMLIRGLDVKAFAYATLLEAALTALAVGVIFHIRGEKLTKLRFRGWQVIRLLRESWPLAASGVFVVATMQLDKVLLSSLASPKAVGVYSVAAQLSSIWYIVPVALGTSVAPTLSRHYKNPEIGQYPLLPNIYRALSLLAISGALVLTAIAPSLISILFGESFVEAVPVFSIHIWTGVFVFHVSIRTRALVAQRQQHLVTLLALLTLITSVTLNMILIPRYGALGSAVASLIAWAFGAIVFPFFWMSTRESAIMFIKSVLPWPMR